MLRRIRTRMRPDTHVNEPRARRRSRGRIIYLVCLFVLAATVLDHLWGNRVIADIDGLVLRESDVIAATNVSRIDEIYVRPGEPVEQGQILMRTSSLDLLDSLANYAVRNAELVEREETLRSRIELVMRLLPLAKDRETEAEMALEGSRALLSRGLLDVSRFEDAAENAYEARKEAAALDVERTTLARELAAISAAKSVAQRAVADLRMHYNDGVVRAAKRGTIGERVPSVGEVYTAGEDILSVISGRPYVLAYLPDTYLFSLKEGLDVRISGARITARGYISEVLPVAQALPPEFSHAFRPDASRQLARIEFHHDASLPTFSTVRITHGAAEAVSDAAEALRGSDWVEASGWLRRHDEEEDNARETTRETEGLEPQDQNTGGQWTGHP